jgi:hypothetical protein
VEFFFHLPLNTQVCSVIKLGTSNWDNCLKILASDAELSKAEQNCFYLRFARQNMDIFRDSDTIEIALKKIETDPNIVINYKKNMSKVFAKCGQHLNIVYKQENNKEPDLLEALENSFIEYTDRIKRGSIKPDEKFAFLLQRINYRKQRREFQYDVDFMSSIVKSYFLQVDYDYDNGLVQKMLIQRLCRSILWEDIPEIYDIKVTSYWRNDSVSRICKELCLKLKLSAPEKFDSLCNKLLEINKPIIISLRNAPEMGSELTSFLNDFWSPLAETFLEKSGVLSNFRLLLFLSGKSDVSQILYNTSIGCPKLLPPLQRITKGDISKWLSCEDVRQFKGDCFRRNNRLDFRSLVYEESQLDSQEPIGFYANDAIEMISETFGFSRDLEQFQQYWELSGDLVA